MQIARLSALTGLRWVLDGFHILRRQPVALVAIAFMNLALMALSMLIPLVGSLGPLILTPIFMVGMMEAARMAESGTNPSPATLFAGFKAQGGRAWKTLALLGVINAIATLVALTVSVLTGGDTLIDLVSGKLNPNDPSLSEGALLGAALAFAVVYLPVQLATWYAPMFIAWDRVPLLKSMFFSIAAILRNKWAFLAYAVGWVVVAVLASLVLRVLSALLAGSPTLWSVILTPVWLIGITAVYCSFWSTYRDAVHRSGPSPMSQTPDDPPPPATPDTTRAEDESPTSAPPAQPPAQPPTP